jgi:hypothetical protein
LSVLPDMPFDPEPYIPYGRCSLLERGPHWWGGGNLFPAAAVGNDGATDRSLGLISWPRPQRRKVDGEPGCRFPGAHQVRSRLEHVGHEPGAALALTL